MTFTTTSKMAALLLAGFLAAGVCGLVVVQRKALERAAQEKLSLQQEIDRLNALSNQLTAEKERLLDLVKAPSPTPETALGQDQFRELLRLRGEVGRRRLEERDAEKLQQLEMQAALARLADSNAQLDRLMKLRSAGVISEQEVNEAKFARDLLDAEARGDKAEAARVRLRYAEEQFARAAELRSKSIISQSEYEEAARKVESLRGIKD